MSRDAELLLFAFGAIVCIIVLIACFKLNSIIALALAAIGLGLIAGMNPVEIARSFEKGMGDVLATISMIIGLGAMIGQMLGQSGGADVIAERIARAFGKKYLSWAMLTAALVIGIPVWFSVGFMLLLPIVFAMARRNSVPYMTLGIPLYAALSTMHSCVPPAHPGPMAAISKLNADVGRTVLYSLIAGIPMAVLAGPVYGRWILKRVKFDDLPAIAAAPPGETKAPKSPPGFALAIGTILLPIVLVIAGTCIERIPTGFLSAESPLRTILKFCGGPLVSMLIATLFSFYSFGYARGFSSGDILKFSNDCMSPIAATLLVVGAGGGFNQVLSDCHVKDAIVHYAEQAKLSPLILGWLVAAMIRIAVGSSTVAITTAVGIVAPLAVGQKGVNLELMVVALGAGSLIFSHVNDGGFWIVKEFFGLTVPQTFKTWSVGTVIGSVTGLLMALLMQAFLG
ncbi:MAG TPA: gluconate:H+ symporter [Planctomycetota bacterium]|nr:gluconate:H+ symporter [Planctomycetota bacterium]